MRPLGGVRVRASARASAAEGAVRAGISRGQGGGGEELFDGGGAGVVDGGEDDVVVRAIAGRVEEGEEDLSHLAEVFVAEATED